MHLQILLGASKVAIAKLHVVIFVGNLTEQIDAVELMEHFQANSVSFNTSLGIRSSQVGLWHPDDLQFFVRDNLVTN